MKTLPDIKKDLEFNKGLASLIEVLKNIAVAQFRVMEQKVKIYERFTRTIDSFFELIDPQVVPHPFLRFRDKPQAVVAVTSDGGLLGGLNMQVVNAALLELEKKPGKLIVIGERGKMYARESRVPFVAFTGVKDEDRYAQAMQVRDYLFNKIREGAFGDLIVVYPYPVSFTVQRVEAARFLPFMPSAKPQTLSKDGVFDVILESKIGDVVEYLLYLWVGQRLYEIFGLSRLAEFAARYIHLEESLQKLKEMDNKLKLQYFRVRHELIDRNMRELFSARLLYAAH
jgi:ATP synthase F1 gamma subunit